MPVSHLLLVLLQKKNVQNLSLSWKKRKKIQGCSLTVTLYFLISLKKITRTLLCYNFINYNKTIMWIKIKIIYVDYRQTIK